MRRVVSKTKPWTVLSGTLIAVLIVAGGGLAQASAVGEAGARAMAAAQGSYYADGSGAVDAADDHQQEAREQAADQVRSNGQAYEEVEAEATGSVNASPVDRPECNCQQAVASLEEHGEGQLATAQHVEESARASNEYVDAGADVQATGEAEAWYEQVFDGVADAVGQVAGVFEQDTDVDEQAQAHVEQSLDTDDEAREAVAGQLEQDANLSSPVEPQISGDADGEHAAQAATSTVTGAGSP